MKAQFNSNSVKKIEKIHSLRKDRKEEFVHNTKKVKLNK